MKTDNECIYMIDRAGKLFRKGEHIGHVDGGMMKLLPEMKRYAGSVTLWLRQEAEAAVTEDAPEPVRVEPSVAAAPKRLTAAELEAQDHAGLDREAREQVLLARAIYQEDLDFSARTGCPPPPKKNPQFGDKTHAFVEWLHQYRHDQFVIRYGVTGRGKVPVLETNPNTGMDEVTGYRETYFALRKTHLTEQDNSREGLSEDMDWNA